MWDFYLAGCETSFRYGGYAIFQIQLAKKQDTVPLTRDYIAQWEGAPPATAAVITPGDNSRVDRMM